MHLTRLLDVPNLLHTLFLLNILTKQNAKPKVQASDNDLKEMMKITLITNSAKFCFLVGITGFRSHGSTRQTNTGFQIVSTFYHQPTIVNKL